MLFALFLGLLLGRAQSGTPLLLDAAELPHGEGDGPGGEEEADDDVADDVEVEAADPVRSGWGVLAWEPLGRRLIVEQVYDHHGNAGHGSTPLLVFDAWEHAYHLQHKNVRPDCVTKLWDLVNWEDVAARYSAAL